MEVLKDPEVELTFTYVSKKAEIKDMTWVVDASNKTATSEIVGPSVDEIKGQIKLSDPIVATIAYTDDKAMINGKVVQSYMDGSIQLKLVGLDKDGKPVSGTSEADIAKITKFVIQATFDEENVAAVSHTATVKFKNKDSQAGLGNDFLYETTFKITVDQQNDKLFTFKRATAYFDGDKAKLMVQYRLLQFLLLLLIQRLASIFTPYIKKVLYQRINRILLHSLKRNLLEW